MNPKTKPTIQVIRTAHQAHLKWWRGQPMLPEEHDAMMACQGFDLMGIVFDEIDRLTPPQPAVSGAV